MSWRLEARVTTKFAALDYVKAARGNNPDIPPVAIASLISAISAMPDPGVGQNVYVLCSGNLDEIGGDFALRVTVDQIFVS